MFKSHTISKLYASNFLTGLIFWYGIEKLFMQHIGIDAMGIGIATAIFIGFTFLLDIPSGMVADRWSRKKVLMLSTIFLAASSMLIVTSTNLLQYIVAEFFYALYIVATSGTYQAITYDTLHEQGKSKDYPKVMGRSFALFMTGAGVAELLGGLIAQATNLSVPFWLSVISCLCNLVLLSTITEPTFHKKEHKERFLSHVNKAVRVVVGIGILRVLIIIWCGLGFAEIFKQDFSQLYMLHFFSAPAAVGALWALYAFALALGNFAAHYLQHQFDLLLILTLALLVAMGVTDSIWGLVFFMLQAIVGAAAFTLTETQIQHAVPSGVRASIMSILSSSIRLVMIPSSFLIGWLIVTFNIFFVLKIIAIISSILLLYWLVRHKKLAQFAYQTST